ncbi:hypothetical protein E4H12_14225 [Candidatus Thorarchaeota archaeon]|nr:MAG: hypothetical protein E4H12_14225 [Candidatus Thorarchaeota archaeon]
MENKNIEVEISSNDDQDVVWDLDVNNWTSTSGFDVATDVAAEMIMVEVDKELMAMANTFAISNADEWLADTPGSATGTLVSSDFTANRLSELIDVDRFNVEYVAAPGTVLTELNTNTSSQCVIPVLNDALTIHDRDGNLVVRIAYDGEVTLGDTIKPSYATEEFWRKVADIGGKFQEREARDSLEIEELEEDLDSERSMRFELQEIIDDIANALGIPQLTENDIADYAAKMKEDFEMLTERFLLEHGHTPDVKEEDPIKAYDRAMKMVR